MMISYDVQFDAQELHLTPFWNELIGVAADHVERLDVTGYANHIWEIFGSLDRQIQETEPFKLFKTDPDAAKALVQGMMERFYTAVNFAAPILPHSVARIMIHIQNRQMPEKPLFAKI
jgi:methionyl-tRNA synthetase